MQIRKYTESFLQSRAWIELDTANLRHNVQAINQLLPENSRIMASIKANAYGHGDVLFAKELLKLGINDFCVADLSEAIELRLADISGNILVLGFTPPSQVDKLVQYDLMQTAVNYEHAEALNAMGKKVRIHIKVDSGMHRLGESCHNVERICQIYRMENLLVEGIFSHHAVAFGRLDEDIKYTNQQNAGFLNVVQKIRNQGNNPGDVHIQSSYSVLNYPKDANCTIARVGLALYGCHSDLKGFPGPELDLRPVLSLRARIGIVQELKKGASIGYNRQHTLTRDSRVAAVQIGYADGMPWNLSGSEAYALVHGEPAPIVGRVCMDQLIIDVTDIPDVHPYSTVTLIGHDEGRYLSAAQIADWAGTVTYEVLSGLHYRLGRFWV